MRYIETDRNFVDEGSRGGGTGVGLKTLCPRYLVTKHCCGLADRSRLLLVLQLRLQLLALHLELLHDRRQTDRVSLLARRLRQSVASTFGKAALVFP